MISLFFHIYFCFESLAVLFRVMNSEILTIFKMLLINENYRLTYTWFKNFPPKSLQIKIKKNKIKSILRLQSGWITSKSKTLQLQNFAPRHFFANNIEICHFCFANCKRPIEYLNIFNCTVFNFENSLS